MKIGSRVYGIINGGIEKRFVRGFVNNGENLCLMTDKGETLVYGSEVFETLKEANHEMRIRFSGI